jgi:peptidoglycan/xylan/chitin deacetylase (PgdA/CDA1 family)
VRRRIVVAGLLFGYLLLGTRIAAARPLGVPPPARVLGLEPGTADTVVLRWAREMAVQYRLCFSTNYAFADFAYCFDVGEAAAWPVHVPRDDGAAFYLTLQACRDGECADPVRAGAVGRAVRAGQDFYAAASPLADGLVRLTGFVRSGNADLRFYRGTSGTDALLDSICSAVAAGESCAATIDAPGALVGAAAAGPGGGAAGITLQVRDTPRIAFMFDDGTGIVQNSEYLMQRILDEYGVKGSFFLTGYAMRTYPAAVRALVASGHRVGNHTWTHPYLTRLSDAAIGQELDRTEAQFRALVPGGSLKPCFRAPNGDMNARVLGVVASHGYRQIYQNVDTNDWAGRPAADIIAHVLARARDGAAVSFHTQEPQTAIALRTLVPVLLAEGFQFVTAC